MTNIQNAVEVVEAVSVADGQTEILSETPPDLSEKYPDWREQAKGLGIPLFQRTKVEVLKEIEKEIESRLVEKPEATLEIIEVPPTAIEPIVEHKEYEEGDPTIVADLLGRIKTLETTVNQLIQRFDRLVDAVTKSKKTKGI